MSLATSLAAAHAAEAVRVAKANGDPDGVLAAAAAAGAGENKGEEEETVKAQQWVPMEEQVPVRGSEKIFHVKDHVYLGTSFGARDRAALVDEVGIGLVINITYQSGTSAVPNHFEGEGDGIEYVNYDVDDKPGAGGMEEAMRDASAQMDLAATAGKRVFVHCNGGQSRSPTLIIAWLMRSHGMSLHDAVRVTTVGRGRQLQVGPSFWMLLAALERDVTGAGPGTKPTVDFTPWFIEDYGRQGYVRLYYSVRLYHCTRLQCHCGCCYCTVVLLYYCTTVRLYYCTRLLCHCPRHCPCHCLCHITTCS